LALPELPTRANCVPVTAVTWNVPLALVLPPTPRRVTKSPLLSVLLLVMTMGAVLLAPVMVPILKGAAVWVLVSSEMSLVVLLAVTSRSGRLSAGLLVS